MSPDEREQERLDEFISDPVRLGFPSSAVHFKERRYDGDQDTEYNITQDEIFTYATRPSRSLLETLADFREVRIPLSHVLEILPPLRRRQFSIASSSKVSQPSLSVSTCPEETSACPY